MAEYDAKKVVLAILRMNVCIREKWTQPADLRLYLSTTTHGLDHLPVIEEESARQCHAIRMVGGCVLESYIQSLHCILRNWSLGLATAQSVQHHTCTQVGIEVVLVPKENLVPGDEDHNYYF